MPKSLIWSSPKAAAAKVPSGVKVPRCISYSTSSRSRQRRNFATDAAAVASEVRGWCTLLNQAMPPPGHRMSRVGHSCFAPGTVQELFAPSAPQAKAKLLGSTRQSRRTTLNATSSLRAQSGASLIQTCGTSPGEDDKRKLRGPQEPFEAAAVTPRISTCAVERQSRDPSASEMPKSPRSSISSRNSEVESCVEAGGATASLTTTVFPSSDG
mmetsp:Transcript_25526/g.58950  ORF Transcript_25526/g.58950 Transcript_25526/m.58950 type:complete len:212 (+) Transcript_25526:1510-2145(+)